MIALASSEGGPSRYVLQPGEAWLLAAAAFTLGAQPSLTATVVPSVLVRAPDGSLLARVLGPPVDAPLHFPTIKCRALLFPEPVTPGGSFDVSVQKNWPAGTAPVFGHSEFYLRAADLADMTDTLNPANVLASFAFASGSQDVAIRSIGVGDFEWLPDGFSFGTIAAGWHTLDFQINYDGTFTGVALTLDGVFHTYGLMEAPPPAVNVGIVNTQYGPFAGRAREWIVWWRNLQIGTTFGGNDLLDFGIAATDLSMFDPDTTWGTDGVLATFDAVGPP